MTCGLQSQTNFCPSCSAKIQAVAEHRHRPKGSGHHEHSHEDLGLPCRAAAGRRLAQKYQRYIGQNDAKRRAQNPDATMNNAIAECSSGKAAHAIPVLEKALQDAKVDLPPRT